MLPKFSITNSLKLPSMSKPVQYRPYTVGEEKDILLIDEHTSEVEFIKKVKALVETCTDGIHLKKVSFEEIMYLAIHIRSKSVGNDATVQVKCPMCFADYINTLKEIDEVQQKIQTGLKQRLFKTQDDLKALNTEFEQKRDLLQKQEEKAFALVPVDLSKIELITNPEHTNIIDLADDVKVELDYGYNLVEIDEEIEIPEDVDPKELKELLQKNKKIRLGNYLKWIAASITHIYDEDTIIQNFTEEEIYKWVESLPNMFIEKLSKFFSTAPKLKYVVNHKCECGYEIEKTISDARSFF